MTFVTRVDPGTVSMSIVVVVYDMAREAPRTLLSLSAGYQTGAERLDYEVLVVDNGSPSPLSTEEVERHGPNFRLHRIDDARPSPVAAINAAVAQTSGEIVGILIDGARLLTPGVLRYAVHASLLYADPIIATLGWHLGPAPQQQSTTDGYDQPAEDRLLERIGWPANGYRLFEIGALAGSSIAGWFWPMAESNCLFLRRSTFEALGGYEERFLSPGGGLANHDFYRRACELAATTPVVLLGEGSFHQLHGGVSTGGRPDRRDPVLYRDLMPEYVEIRGEEFRAMSQPIEYLGGLPPQALPFVEESAVKAAERAAIVARQTT